MNQLPPPNPMTFEGNVAENWSRWIQQFRLYLNATGLDKKPQQQQCSCLLTVAGPEALEIFNTFALSDTDQTKIEVVISKFEEYCTPKKNVTYERHVFNMRRRERPKELMLTSRNYASLQETVSLENYMIP